MLDQHHFLPRQEEHTRFQILHQETTAPSCHCELVKVEQVLIEEDITVRRTANGLGDSFFGFN